MGHGDGSYGLTDERNVGTLYVLDHHYFVLGKVMNSQVIQGVSENGFLNQNDISAGLDYLLDDLHDVESFLLKNLVYLGVVGNHDVVFHVGFRGRNAELKDCDLRVLDL